MVSPAAYLAAICAFSAAVSGACPAMRVTCNVVTGPYDKAHGVAVSVAGCPVPPAPKISRQALIAAGSCIWPSQELCGELPKDPYQRNRASSLGQGLTNAQARQEFVGTAMHRDQALKRIG
jgi:hypothetical protein